MGPSSSDAKVGDGGVLRLLGLALKAGRLRLGAGPVLRALEKEGPGIVFLATDAGADLSRKVRRSIGRSQLDATLFSNQELAAAFGRNSLAVVSVHDADFVRGLRDRLEIPD